MAGKPRAVIVEGDEYIAGMLCYFLELQGIRCAPAATAQQGLDLVAADHTDLAIVDASLSDHDGWWMLGALRDRPGLARLPVVVLTGQSEAVAPERAAALTCECLRKPFSYEQLHERMDAAMRLAAGEV